MGKVELVRKCALWRNYGRLVRRQQLASLFAAASLHFLREQPMHVCELLQPSPLLVTLGMAVEACFMRAAMHVWELLQPSPLLGTLGMAVEVLEKTASNHCKMLHQGQLKFASLPTVCAGSQA